MRVGGEKLVFKKCWLYVCTFDLSRFTIFLFFFTGTFLKNSSSYHKNTCSSKQLYIMAVCVCVCVHELSELVFFLAIIIIIL